MTGEDAVRPLVSVVVPAYNEAQIITDSLRRLTGYLESLEDVYRWELVIVNDGSTDETGPLADAFALDHPQVRVLHHRVNFSLGQALRYAFNATRGDYVAVVDCDLSYEPEHIGRMLFTMQDTGARIVVASPYAKGGQVTNLPAVRRVLSRTANRLLSFTSRAGISTITGMVRVYDGRFLRSLDLKSMDAEINTEIIYKAQILQARIVEIPAHLDWTFDATGGRRRTIPNLSLSRTTLRSLFASFLFRPFLFFILPGLLMLALAAYSFFWVAWHVVQVWDEPSTFGNAGFTGAVQNAYARAPHTFLVTGVTLILGVQLVSLGIIALQAKRYFEDLFHLGTSVYRRLGPEPVGLEPGLPDRADGPPPAA